MEGELTLRNLLPELSDATNIRNRTFVGIDFGTSTSVVSFSLIGDRHNPITTRTITLLQLLDDGRLYESHLVPTAIAWYCNQLLIGAGAHQLKQRLHLGRNLWHSFKIELGTDLGPRYYSSELGQGHPIATILTPKDAAIVFFRFLKEGITRYIEENGLPRNVFYAISIPAAFEANQRRELLEALQNVGIPVENRALIDEPNAAFLNYIAEYNTNNLQYYHIPEDRPLHIMVFDFGAGTCDISILEIGKAQQGYYSKNLSISRFEPLGGNDIDKAIAYKILLPQVLERNSLSQDALRTPDINKRIIPALLGYAEIVKIKICKQVAAESVANRLPQLAYSDERISLAGLEDIRLPKRSLKVGELSLSYREFAEVMAPFLDLDSASDHYDEEASVVSVFTLIHSALRKADLSVNDLDLLLMIGGSSQNPYVHDALVRAMPDVEMELPLDMRSHVSMGAAIHSQLLHGFGINIIRPIISEPLFYLTRDNQLNVLVPAGTSIPSSPVTIARLFTGSEWQDAIEIPIYVSVREKLLYVIRIPSEDGKGFPQGTTVTLNAELTADKLVKVQAITDKLAPQCEYLNPFANTPLTSTKRKVMEALKQANQSAAQNHGRPSVDSLKTLANAYAEDGNHLRAAETLETVQQMDSIHRYETDICYHYSHAGRTKLSQQWADIAYQRNPTTITAFNLALDKENDDETAYVELMEQSLKLDCDAYYTLLVYGQFLKRKQQARGTKLIERAYHLMFDLFELGRLPISDYGRLVKAAKLLKQEQIVQRVEKEWKQQMTHQNEFAQENLLEKVGLLSESEVKAVEHT